MDFINFYVKFKQLLIFL